MLHQAPIKRFLFLLSVAALALAVAACGPGWEGYQDNYSDVGPLTLGPWEGDEHVIVVLEETEVDVALEGIQTYDFNGALSVLLSDLIIQSGTTLTPELYRYNFTATDGYDLLIKRYSDVSLLPGWEEMKAGYLYFDTRFDDLTCGWTRHPWGSAESAYNVKWMNQGIITLMEP